MKNLLTWLLLPTLLLSTSISHAQQPPTDPAVVLQYLKSMQEQMLYMHDLSNKILAETDPVKQQALKDQQLEIMKSQYLQAMSQQQQRPNY